MSEKFSTRPQTARATTADLPADRAMCRDTHGHVAHFWYGGDGAARWCSGVNVARWWNALAEQQGHDRQAQQ
jgi:hypothetical protein